MKTNVFFAALFSVFALASCDIVEDPLKDGSGGGGPAPTETLRSVLIEEFTGHKCNNCPNAAAEIKTIQGLEFGNRVYAVGIHVTEFFAGTNSDYPTEFRTSIGNEYETFFSLPSLPKGMVSRTDYSASGAPHMKNYTAWASEAFVLTAELAKFEILPSLAYNDTSRKVTIDVDIPVLQEYTGNLNFMVMITENDIVSPQKMPDGSRNPNYVHQHVLRGGPNGSWGTNVSTGTALEGDTLTYSGSMVLDGSWDKDNCYVLMFIYDTDNQEIWQVTEEHVP
ncbi:MAG: hypothetical protein SchgKO_20360 [Schleiferiaceae bacterium]